MHKYLTRPKKQNKPILSRCVLTDENVFILYEPNGKRVRNEFNINECQKVSRYQDNSWEITHKSGKSLRFLCEKNKSNLWFETIYSRFNKAKELEVKDNIVTTEDIFSEEENNIYDNICIDRELTHPNIFAQLSPGSPYTLKINEEGVSLQNDKILHLFEAR